MRSSSVGNRPVKFYLNSSLVEVYMTIRFGSVAMATALMLILNTALSQTRVLNGTVSGGGAPIPGVSVMIKQTTTGTVTDKDGRFSLEIPEDEPVVLVLSFMGPYTERKIGKNENNIRIRMDSHLGYHAVYLSSGPAFSKLSSGENIQRGFTLSLGYRYQYYKFGLGAELSLHQGLITDEAGTIVHVGVPLIGYYRVGKDVRALIGSGFYLNTYGYAQNELKILGGLQYEKRFWTFGLRYLNGTRKMFKDQGGVIQTLQLTLQYRVN